MLNKFVLNKVNTLADVELIETKDEERKTIKYSLLGKNMVANNIGAPVYTNYFITQIQTSPISETGDNLIILQLSYDES